MSATDGGAGGPSRLPAPAAEGLGEQLDLPDVNQGQVVHQQRPSQSIQVAVQHQQGMALEVAALQKLSGDQVLEVVRQQHDLALRGIELEEKRLEREASLEESREKRDDAREQTAAWRVERFAWALLLILGVVTAVLLARNQTDAALKLLGLAFSHIVTLVGGMGLQRLRDRGKAKRSAEPRE